MLTHVHKFNADVVYFQSRLCDFNSWSAWVASDTAFGFCVIVLMNIPSFDASTLML